MDNKQRLNKEDSKINISFMVNSFRNYWWVYAVMLCLFLGLAAIYVKVKSPSYEIYSSIILNDDENDSKGSLGGLGSLMASFSLGGSGYKYVEDELVRIRSHSSMMELVEKLGLNETYTSKKGFFSQRQTYFNDSPVKVYIPESVIDTMSVSSSFRVKVSPDGRKADIIVKQKKDEVYNRKGVNLPAMVKTPYGTFQISTTSFFKPGEELDMKIGILNPADAAKSVNKKLSIKSPSKKSDLVFINYEDVNIERGKAVLNTLVDIYNNKLLKDYRNQAQASVDFVKDRLEKLYNELEKSETSIESYKRANKIVDASAEAEYIFLKKQTAERSMIEYETRASVLKMIIEFLQSDKNKYSLIPFADDMPKEPVEEYNKLVMERLRLQENAKGNNAALKSISAQVDAMRANLIGSLESQLSATRIAISDMNRAEAGTASRISDYPTMEKDLLSLYRDQKIKNQIYSYLLQKLEENELKLSRDIKIGKVVDEAYPNIEPSSPNALLVFVAASAFSVLCTYCGLWILSILSKLTRRHRQPAAE